MNRQMIACMASLLVLVLAACSGPSAGGPKGPEGQCSSPSQVVDIPDFSLRSVIRSKTGWDDITCSDMAKVESLSGLSSVNSIEGLQYAVNLKSLNLAHNHVTDLSPLSDLKQLEYLDITSNELSDLEPLVPVGSLVSLDASFNEIVEIWYLGALQNLKFLDLQDNLITSVSDLHQLVYYGALQELYVQDNCLDLTGPFALGEIQVFKDAGVAVEYEPNNWKGECD